MTLATDFAPTAGVPLQLGPDLSCLLAPNPSAMTGPGTNTFLLGDQSLAVIDPGPDDTAHLSALINAIAGRVVTHIFVTHSHMDHSALAHRLSRDTGAAVYAFGDSQAGRSVTMQKLAATTGFAAGEGVDRAFYPDHRLADNDIIAGDWGEICAMHTPGHMGNHMSFCWRDTVFCGDHVMAWSTSMISPPDGDMTAFLQSCERLKLYSANMFYPAHGAPIHTPTDRLDWVIAHRLSREAQVLALLAQGPHTAAELTKRIYTDLQRGLLGAAQSNVMAHLISLFERRIVTVAGAVSWDSTFALQHRK